MTPTLRRTPAVALALAVGLVATGCTDAAPAAPDRTLEVATWDWNGWEEPTGDPEVTTGTMPVAEGEAVTVPTVSGDLVLTVASAGDDGVVVAFDTGLALLDEDGGFAPRDLVEEVAVAPGETVILMTPTLDAGSSVQLTLSA